MHLGWAMRTAFPTRWYPMLQVQQTMLWKITAPRCCYIISNALDMNRYRRFLEVCHSRLDQCVVPAEGKGMAGSQEGTRGLEGSEGVLICLWQKRQTCAVVQVGGWASVKVRMQGISLVVQWLRPHMPNAEVPGLIPGQEIRFHLPQWKIPHPARKTEDATCCNKTQCSQINKNKYTKRKKAWMWLEMISL